MFSCLKFIYGSKSPVAKKKKIKKKAYYYSVGICKAVTSKLARVQGSTDDRKSGNYNSLSRTVRVASLVKRFKDS